MKSLIALLLLASAAHADPRVTWGTSSATLSRCRDADACVAVVNMLSAAPDIVDRALELDGLVVLIHVDMGDGDKPDTATLILPAGFWSEPKTVTIDEGHSAVFRIFFPLVG